MMSRISDFFTVILITFLVVCNVFLYAHPSADLHHKDIDISLGGFKGTPLGEIAYKVSDSIDNEMPKWFREKYGSIPGNHRIFSHGYTLGEDIPRDLLDSIREQYGEQAVSEVIKKQQEIASRFLKEI